MHNRVFVHPRDQREFEALVRYMMRPPVSLSRLHFTPGSHEVVYLPKAGHDDIEPTEGERIDAVEFVARVLVQIPDPRRHLVRYYGAYSNARRGKREKAAASAEPSSPDQAPEDPAIPDGPHRAALRRRWAELIRRVYEVDPLVCPRCGSEMRVIGFITQPALIDRILDHLRRRDKIPRPPPLSTRLWAPSSPTGGAQVGLRSRRAAPAAGSPRLPRRPPRAVARAPRKGSSYPFRLVAVVDGDDVGGAWNILRTLSKITQRHE